MTTVQQSEDRRVPSPAAEGAGTAREAQTRDLRTKGPSATSWEHRSAALEGSTPYDSNWGWY